MLMLMLTRIKTLMRQILIQVTMVTNQLRIPTMPRPDMVISKRTRPAMDSNKLIRLVIASQHLSLYKIIISR